MSTSDTADTSEVVIPTTLRLDQQLHQRIRVAAAYERKSMADWMREALELVVERVEAKRDA